MDTKPETLELESILRILDTRIQAKTEMIAEDNAYLLVSLAIVSNRSEEYNARIRYNIEYSIRTRDVLGDIRALVQDRLDSIRATPKKSLLVAGNIPAGCACPFAKSIPCTMQMAKCPTEGKTHAFSFSCALARGFDLAEQERK